MFPQVYKATDILRLISNIHVYSRDCCYKNSLKGTALKFTVIMELIQLLSNIINVFIFVYLTFFCVEVC